MIITVIVVVIIVMIIILSLLAFGDFCNLSLTKVIKAEEMPFHFTPSSAFHIHILV